MRLTLPTLLLAALAACGDPSSTLVGDNPSTSNNPLPPINGADDGDVFTQPGSPIDGEGDGGETVPPPGGAGGGSTPNTNVSGSGGSGGGGSGGNNPPGAPVPEPGTMFLVGSGLAGAAYARRRRKQVGEQPSA